MSLDEGSRNCRDQLCASELLADIRSLIRIAESRGWTRDEIHNGLLIVVQDIVFSDRDNALIEAVDHLKIN